MTRKVMWIEQTGFWVGPHEGGQCSLPVREGMPVTHGRVHKPVSSIHLLLMEVSTLLSNLHPQWNTSNGGKYKMSMLYTLFTVYSQYSECHCVLFTNNVYLLWHTVFTVYVLYLWQQQTNFQQILWNPQVQHYRSKLVKNRYHWQAQGIYIICLKIN